MMKSIMTVLIASFLVSPIALAHAADLVDYWEGSTTHSGEVLNFRLRFTENDGQVAGTIGLPDNSRLGVPFDQVTVKRTKVGFSVSRGGLRASLKGRV